MKKLRKFVEEVITEHSRQLKLSPTSKNWTALARLLLARVVMLNK
jgi:GTP1/Obg family GTP-binding protein